MATKTSGGTVTHEVDYTYDIFNRRIGKTVDADGDGAGTATEEIYIYDGLRQERGAAGDHILLAFDESDDLTDRFLYGPNVDQVLASEEVTSTASAGDVLWALTDHLGTVRDVADYNAGTNTTTVQNHLTYNAFGEITAETNAAVDFLFAFTGRERDEESDLQYNRARYYDAAIGKWVSEDPIGFLPGDNNLSRYVGNSPGNGVDPSGLESPSGATPIYGGYGSIIPEIPPLLAPVPGVPGGTIGIGGNGAYANLPNLPIPFGQTNIGSVDLIFSDGRLSGNGQGGFEAGSLKFQVAAQFGRETTADFNYEHPCLGRGSVHYGSVGLLKWENWFENGAFQAHTQLSNNQLAYQFSWTSPNGESFHVSGIDEFPEATARLPNVIFLGDTTLVGGNSQEGPFFRMTTDIAGIEFNDALDELLAFAQLADSNGNSIAGGYQHSSKRVFLDGKINVTDTYSISTRLSSDHLLDNVSLHYKESASLEYRHNDNGTTDIFIKAEGPLPWTGNK
ncbi:RHS repeat-associated core domain-containing protein [Blastopirellula marina]|uniref:Teneurin-like YD-shell domain-containing protein n=1 Tax=Blastopirellula marina TaxID=124 RepID=A0A2S8G8F1_9BACT|nr:RHS repeat-associated core domain-containing protein [Blastopirellula marina]PQO40726.1 hypothetical protein C5Y98_05780 [Blastopirellula marina]PTL45686.1 RHS repeat-associated core domain-containing protein [Blastopirellula marina]